MIDDVVVSITKGFDRVQNEENEASSSIVISYDRNSALKVIRITIPCFDDELLVGSPSHTNLTSTFR